MIITVVGHGPSPVGKALGELIDRNPVIRMHNHAWQNAGDYGARTDYCVWPGPWGRRWYREKKVAPAVAWLCYRFGKQKKIPREHLGVPVKKFDIAPFANTLRPFVPTRGTAGVLMAAALGAKEVRLVGLDSIISGVITQYAPGAGVMPDELIGQQFARRRRHDYVAEGRALFRWLEDRGIAVVS